VVFTGFYANKYPRFDTATPAAYSPPTPNPSTDIPKPNTNHFQSILDAPRLKFPTLLRALVTKTLNPIQNPDTFHSTHSPSISSKKSQYLSLTSHIASLLTDPALLAPLQLHPKNYNFLTQDHIPYLKSQFTAISSNWHHFTQKFHISWPKIFNLKDTIISKIDIENFSYVDEDREIFDLRSRKGRLEEK
jgi:hypothetical protein